MGTEGKNTGLSIQKWVDHSISVTVNVPNETSVDLVKEIYKTAWESGCKGCTIYRDGSRSGVLVASDEKENKQEDKQTTTESGESSYNNVCSQAP
ncbi:MAG: hypothetical protein R2788_18310 [Saprospiraceae bacterium]